MSTQPPDQPRPIPVRHVNPAGLISQYTNEPVFTHSAKEIFASFFLIEQPIVVGKEELDKVDHLDAIAIVKLVMTPEVAETMLVRLQELLKIYKERMGQK